MKSNERDEFIKDCGLTLGTTNANILAQGFDAGVSSMKVKISVMTEALLWADEFFTARDEMNAKVHCAPLRLSPITERVKQALAFIKDKTPTKERE